MIVIIVSDKKLSCKWFAVILYCDTFPAYYKATTFAAWIIASSNGGGHLSLASDLFDLF